MSIPSVSLPLHSGGSLSMPLLGLGTYQSSPVDAKPAVIEAIRSGYRHIDCAEFYDNEEAVGEGLKECFDTGVVRREDVFLTSKVWNCNHRPEFVRASCLKSIEKLQCSYLDLYLVHWPYAFPRVSDANGKPQWAVTDAEGNYLFEELRLEETWRAMEELVKDGLVRCIGVSNFNQSHITTILSSCTIKPVCNQIESHPYLSQTPLISFCRDLGIQTVAYCPLGRRSKQEHPFLQQDPTILAIAQEVGRTPAQVLLRWQMQRGVGAIPKSVNAERIRENFGAGEFSLDEGQMGRIDGLNRDFHFVHPRWLKSW